MKIFATILFLLISLFISNKLQCQQYPFYDALNIYENCMNADNSIFIADDKLLKVLIKYYPDVKDINTLITEINSNPFLNQYSMNLKLQDFNKLNVFLNQLSIRETSLIDKGILSVKGIDVTSFADAMAKFIIKRAKEELSIAFFEKFKKEITDNEYENLQLLFPVTYRILDKIDVEIYQYSGYINSLREAFKKDLSNLFDNLKNVLNNSKNNGYIKNETIRVVVDNSFQIMRDLKNKNHPGEIIANYPISHIEKFQNSEFTGAFKTIQLISESFRSKTNQQYWVRSDSITLLFNNKNDFTLFKIYLGLLYQQAKDINFNNVQTLRDLLNTCVPSTQKKDSFYKIKNLIEDFTDHCSEIEENIIKIKGANKSELDKNDYYRFINSTINLIELSKKIVELPYFGNSSSTISTEIDKYLLITRGISDVFLDVSLQHYSSAIMNTVALLDNVFSEQNQIKETIRLILKYGTFMAAVTQATNSEEVEQAIESIALPVGSYRIKRNSSICIELSSYIGIMNSSDNNQFKQIGQWGLSTPIGLNVSTSILDFLGDKGRGYTCNGSGLFWKPLGWLLSPFFVFQSISLNLSVFDLGPIVNSRLHTTETTSLPVIKLSDILSPGAYLVFGIRGIPLSIGIGGQYSNQLIIDTQNNSTNSQANKWMWNIFLSVDIPLLNLYTKPE